MNHPRNNYWSMLKGIAILAVVMIHIPLTADTNSLIATRQVINFPVAMFIFLSGYFAKQEDNTWRSVKRLLFPYLIWSSFWCIITPQPVNSLIVKYLTGGFSILYFLFVLIQLKLLTPFLFRHLTKEDYKPIKDPLWLITPFYLLIFSIIRLSAAEWFASVDSIVAFDNFFPAWLIYYYLGMYCKINEVSLRPSNLCFAVLCTLVVCLLISFHLSYKTDIQNFPYTQSRVTSMLYAISIVLLFYSLHDANTKHNFLAVIGEMSFGIYLLHIPVLIICQKYVEILHIPILQTIYGFPLIRYLVVLLITICVLQLIYKVVPLKFVRILGLK